MQPAPDYVNREGKTLLPGFWDHAAFPLLFQEPPYSLDWRTYKDKNRITRRDYGQWLIYSQSLAIVRSPTLAQEYFLALNSDILNYELYCYREASAPFRQVTAKDVRNAEDRESAARKVTRLPATIVSASHGLSAARPCFVCVTVPAPAAGAPAPVARGRALYQMLERCADGDTWWHGKFTDTLFAAANLGTQNTIFTTFTLNKDWQGVRDFVTAHRDRPRVGDNVRNCWDVLVRIFSEIRENLHSLLKDGRTLPGKPRPCSWWLEVVESQMRGLLHGHMIHSFDGPEWTVDEIDSMIMARRPTDDEAHWVILYSPIL